MSYIGLFDSGIGGLTVAKEIIEKLPDESIVYFGDTAHSPYGEKKSEEIIALSLEAAELLMPYALKALVVACNTASACALPALQDRLNLPVIGVIDTALAVAAKTTKNNRVAILATTATIKSEVYQRALKKLLPKATLFPLPCPKLVPLLEKEGTDTLTFQAAVKESLLPLKGSGIDTAILGCTHYPLLSNLIEDELGKAVSLVSSSEQAGRSVVSLLKERGLLNTSQTPPKRLYLVSSDPQKFYHLSHRFFGDMVGEVLVTASRA